MRYTLFSEKLWELGEQLPGCYGDEAPQSLTYDNKDRLKQDAWEKFQATDMFFVKVSCTAGNKNIFLSTSLDNVTNRFLSPL